ncbi:MAG: 3-dehydroquinate synthase [Oscillospiraceae bacterium]|nr:3-dehydroquinate synthase [Oscillospiraceae bacterium]
MKTIEVCASRRYDVCIGSGLLPMLGHYTKTVCKASKVCIVSDSNVFPLHGQTAMDSLIAAGFEAIHFVFPAGEESKSGTVYLQLLNFLAENQITRSDCLVALGGGVVGDLTGFAAATFLRGIPFIQVPTTLLAAVDSSVGGKTAIDLPAGKNLCGAFYQPNLVLCDTDTLNTLPEEIFLDGCAEVIKYAILYDAALFSYLTETGPDFDRETIIARCVELKRNVVMEDEFDTGARMKLNLGHTIGHGVEAQSNFTISHGKAVAIGMAIVARAAAAIGICSHETKEQIIAIIQRFKLPTQTTYSADALLASALSDKKRSGGTVNLIIPAAIGDCPIVPTPVTELKSFIEAGL